jgi:hypothetical protein
MTNDDTENPKRQTPNHKKISIIKEGIRAKVEDFDFQIFWRLNIGVCDFSKNLLSR